MGSIGRSRCLVIEPENFVNLINKKKESRSVDATALYVDQVLSCDHCVLAGIFDLNE